MTKFRNLRQFHTFLPIPIILLINDSGNIDSFLLRDPTMQDANDILKSDTILMVDTLKQDLYVVDDTLLEDHLVNSGVHLDKPLKRDGVLFSEDLL